MRWCPVVGYFWFGSWDVDTLLTKSLRAGKCRAALAEARKDAEEALVMAETREKAFRSREAAAEERAAAAEGRARQWEKQADELGQALSHKVNKLFLLHSLVYDMIHNGMACFLRRTYFSKFGERPIHSPGSWPCFGRMVFRVAK